MGRPNLAQTALVYSITLAAITLLGWILMYWTWLWFAPFDPETSAHAATRAIRETSGNGAGIAAAQDLFGIARREQDVIAPPRIAIKLLGVVAASGGRRGYAVMQLDANHIVAVLESEDITPDTRLAEVHPDYVILERGGSRETLAWPAKSSSADSRLSQAENSTTEPLVLPNY